MKQSFVLSSAHKAEVTGFYKPAIDFLVEDTGKSFTEAVTAIGKAVKAGLLAGTPHRHVTLTDKGRVTLAS